MLVFQKYSNKIDDFIFNDVWQSLNFSKIGTKAINVQIVIYFVIRKPRMLIPEC